MRPRGARTRKIEEGVEVINESKDRNDRCPDEGPSGKRVLLGNAYRPDGLGRQENSPRGKNSACCARAEKGICQERGIPVVVSSNPLGGLSGLSRYQANDTPELEANRIYLRVQ